MGAQLIPPPSSGGSYSADINALLGSANNAAARAALELGTGDSVGFGNILTLGSGNGAAAAISAGDTTAIYCYGSGYGPQPLYINSGGGINLVAGGPVILAAGGAHVLYQRNGTNAQAFWLANTDDGSGNYELLGIKWTSNEATIEPSKGGTGVARVLALKSEDGSAYIKLNNFASRIEVSQNIYGVAGITFTTFANSGVISFNAGAAAINAAGTSASSSTTGVLVLTGGFATSENVQAGGLIRGFGFELWNAAGNISFSGAGGMIIRGGTGTPEGVVAANVGSIYLRSDGGASTSLYVKESGAGNTGWVGK